MAVPATAGQAGEDSHYMDDVTALCPRVIVIDRGKLIYDGALEELVRRVRPDKRVNLRLSRKVARADLEKLGRVVEQQDASAILQISKDQLQAAVTAALASLPLVDLTIEDPPLEEVMRDLFAQEASAREANPTAGAPPTAAPAEAAR